MDYKSINLRWDLSRYLLFNSCASLFQGLSGGIFLNFFHFP